MIDFLKKAGIKVWVLTGDKLETAMNIALSADIINSSMNKFTIDEVELYTNEVYE